MTLLISCAEAAQPRIRTFVGAMEHARGESDLPVGLNPLGFLKSCPRGEKWSGATPRVVVSRPDLFSRAASEMIVALYQALEEDDDELKPVEMVLSPEAIENGSQAISEGGRCGAMVVLWEGNLQETLELALPNPDRIPLRALVPARLCEFGNHMEQVNILYLTIMGLTATAKGKFQKANNYLTEAAGLDAHCLSPPPGLGSPIPPTSP